MTAGGGGGQAYQVISGWMDAVVVYTMQVECILLETKDGLCWHH